MAECNATSAAEPRNSQPCHYVTQHSPPSRVTASHAITTSPTLPRRPSWQGGDSRSCLPAYIKPRTISIGVSLEPILVEDTNVTTCREHDYLRKRHFDHSYAQASDDQSPNKVAHVKISDANVPSEGQFVPVASSNIAQLTVAELVEPSSSSLTEINTFASTSSQEATTGYIIIR
ncbi:hypothetical protein ACJJTC_010536 [Scirpophaga incertulas]